MPDHITIRFGHAVCSQRRSKHLSQEKLSEITGISKRHLANIEKGIVNPSLEVIDILAKELNLSLDNIIHEDLDETDQILNILRIRMPEYTDEDKKFLYRIVNILPDSND